MEKCCQVKGTERAMVKAGLSEKVTCEHRRKGRRSEPAVQGDENKVTEGWHRRCSPGKATEGHGSRSRPWAFTLGGIQNHWRFLSWCDMTDHTFLNEHYGGSIEKKL